VIFGPLPLDEAEGAVLGHTLRVAGGGVIKKGRVLTGADVEGLRSAGHSHVIGARLGPGDVPEDEAAARLGAALARPGIAPAEAFTGRCNLIAERLGVLVVAPAVVEAINSVDEAVTLATLAPFAVVSGGEIVATVKIIPFGVEAGVVGRCAALAEGDPAAFALAPLAAHQAGLVLTRLEGTREELLDRAEATMRQRLERLGSRVVRVERCAHHEATVAEAIARLRHGGCAPILLLGASAIVDRHDVLPAAVVRCGGRIEHFGMPVDPGNLLLLAELEGVDVVGVPGCARSLRPSGFDQVLERLLAGLPVRRAQLQAMGVGGLLKEIGARPQPRAREAAEAPPRRVAALVLAAGESRRMGAANKLLSEVEGAPMVVRVVDAALASRADPVVVVTGHDAERVRGVLAGRAVRFAHNADYASGMSTSLRAGLTALAEEPVDGALVCLGDMPWVRAEHLDALVAAFDPERGREIVAPFVARKRGNPILWGARFFGPMARLTGDRGARELLEQHAEQIHGVPLDDEGVLVDVDTPEALALVDRKSEPPRAGA
jgi:molybdenum cofactor cytidylyltransferase